MRELISLLISPVPFLFLLLISAFISNLLKRRKTASLFLVLSIIWFLIISTPLIPDLLAGRLERQYKQLSDEEIRTIPDSVNIIVLGAGHTDEKELSPNNQLNGHAILRLTEGIRLQKKITGSRLITSGLGYRTSLPGAVVMYRTALMLGMDSSSLEISDMPMNTYSEADQYLKKFGREKKLVLVTSAIHMPRSVLLFRSKGIEVVPAPTDFLIRNPSNKSPWRWVPASDNTGKLEQAIHEYGGIIWFRIGGK